MSFNSIKTLFWAPEFHDTAKLPERCREIPLKHAQKLHKHASNILYRAIKYAPPDVIQTYSLSIELPPQANEELQALKEPLPIDSPDTLEETETKEPNILLYPNCWLIQFKDEFDAAEIKHFEHLQYNRERERILDDLVNGNPVNNKDVVYLLRKEPKVSPPVVTAQNLTKLKRCVDELQHFWWTVNRNVDKIYRDSYWSRGERNRHPHGSPRRLRSQRLGSSLRYSTAVDEEWSEEGEWGMPLAKKHRPMMWNLG
ncbi:hypothetical protein FSARC_3930 [Fusarium sarcochroum]|uniref:Uncharacterized protein n=1 Tax=Fusarium sarcochroum TaxID=1208366 RepID=A0A8H4U2S7_9HYPO|nr:hypothetical protein FSARC_3930 [Fusarium sarcochroum]